MKNKHPGREECLKMLKDYGTPEHVIRHCLAVTAVAIKIAEALVDKGFKLNLPLIQSAGLLHDIARVDDKHWITGAEFAVKNGYLEEAEIIRRHMRHPFDPDPAKLTELDLVCLGDRLILEDKYVGIDIRMDYVIKKVNGDKRVEKFILERKKITKKLIENIENTIGASVEELILETGGREEIL